MPEGAEPKQPGDLGAQVSPGGSSAISEGKAFISYASRDTAIADDMCDALEGAGIPCWLAPRDVRPGDFYADAIVQALASCRVLILVLSEASIDSPHVLREVERASSKRRPIVAFRTDTATLPAGLEYFLSASQWLDASAGRANRQFPKLIDAVRSRGASSESAAVGPPRTFGAWRKNGRKTSLVVVTAIVAVMLAFFTADKLWFPKHVAGVPPAPANLVAGTATFTPPPHSIAVLPFTNFSGDPQQEYFSDGISEELINALSHIDSLKVAARTSSFYFKGKDVDIGTIARKLDVAAVLEGSIRRSGNTIRITAQLINTVNGFHIWSENYDRDLKDVLVLQTNIATAVAQQLRAKLLGDEAAKIEVGGTHNPEAYDAYLLGLQLSHGGNLDSYRSAVGAFQKATEIDDGYAGAYANLAISEANAADYTGDAAGLERARVAADKALVLAPQLAKGYQARVLVRRNSLDFPGARADAERALALAPNDSHTRNVYGVMLATFGRLPEATEATRKAIELDQLNEAAWFNLSLCLTAVRDFTAARRAAERGLALSPNDDSARFSLGTLDLFEDRNEDALVEFQKSSDEVFRLLGMALAEYSRGHGQPAQQALKALIAKHAADAAYQVAEVYSWRGDTNNAFQWLDRAFRQRDSGLNFVTYDLLLTGLRSDPRYSALLKKLKLFE